MKKVHSNSYKKFNKKFIVTALGVAALGVQLVQTNTAKADTTSDSTGSSTEQASNVNKNEAAIADSSSIKDNGNSSITNETSNKMDSNAGQNNSETDTTKSGIVAASDDISNTSTGTTAGTNLESSTTTNNTNNGSDTDTTKNSTQEAQPVVDTATNSDDVLINNPEVKPLNYPDPVKAAVSISATNDKASATSQSTDDNKDDTIIVDAHAKTITANYTITNTSDKAQSDYETVLMLPKFEKMYNNNSILMSDDTDLKSYITGLPKGAKVTYLTDTGGYATYEQHIADDPNFKLSSVNEITIVPSGTSLGSGQTIKVTIPLVNNNKSTTQAQTATLGVYTYTNYFRVTHLIAYFKGFSDNISGSSIKGQYPAVTVNRLNVSYTAADKELQDQMPSYISGSDIQINNFNQSDKNQLVDADKTNWTYISDIYVNLVNSGITKIANNDGYSMLLNPDGSQQTEYSYKNSGSQTGPTIHPNPNNEGTSGGSSIGTIPGIYISMRHVINASDGTTKVGETWTAADNLKSVQDNNDTTLTGNDAVNAVSTTITDKNGVLKDGKVVKAGTFTVTYTYKLKDGTPIIKTVTVTADPAKNNNSGSSTNNSGSSNNSSGTSTDTSDPLISPNSPEDINDVDRLVSTHPKLGNVTLYTLEVSKVQNRSLKPATDWFSDKEMSFGGDTYYRVATNEWVKAASVYVYENRNIVIQTNADQQLVDSQGNNITSHELLANTAWRVDRIAYINGKTYYRVATNQFVPTDAVTVL